MLTAGQALYTHPCFATAQRWEFSPCFTEEDTAPPPAELGTWLSLAPEPGSSDPWHVSTLGWFLLESRLTLAGHP